MTKELTKKEMEMEMVTGGSFKPSYIVRKFNLGDKVRLPKLPVLGIGIVNKIIYVGDGYMYRVWFGDKFGNMTLWEDEMEKAD